MTVLEDLSGKGEGETFSCPTSSFVSHEFEEGSLNRISLEEAREKYGKSANILFTGMKDKFRPFRFFLV